MTDKQTRIFITQLHEEGCRGCIHKKYGGCPSLSKDRKYCHTKIHDAAETIRQLADELEETQDKLCELLSYVTGNRFSKPTYSITEMKSFADDYFQQECQKCEELAQVKRERDAAIRDLKEVDKFACEHCKHYALEMNEACMEADVNCEKCKNLCSCHDCEVNSQWEWRGVQP